MDELITTAVPVTFEPPVLEEVEEDERAECYGCGVRLEVFEEYEYDYNIYCSVCHDDVAYTNCSNCGEAVENDRVQYYNDDPQCSRCYDEFIESEDSDEDEEHSGGYRHYSTEKLPGFMSKDTGQYVTSPRIFSAEIEGYYPSSDALDRATRDLPRAFGVSGDGSLGSRGIEFQTPMLQGKNGEDAIRLVTKVLNDNEFTTNRSAGLHIHLDGAGLVPKRRTKDYPRELVALLSFYLSFEDVMMSFLPPSRRSNRYCHTMRNEYHSKEFQNVRNLEQLEKLWYRVNTRRHVSRRKNSKYDESRYNGVNVHSLLKDGHLEIRYHSGTMNSTKILEWVNLHQTILDLAVKNWAYMVSVSDKSLSLPDMDEKTELFFEALALPTRARLYFLDRQTTFASTKADLYENKSLAEVCAG